MKITKPPSAPVAAALDKLAAQAKPLDAAVAARIEQATVAEIDAARARALDYTNPAAVGTAPADAAQGRAVRSALVRAALQDVDAALAQRGKPDAARGVLGARLQEATARPGTDVLALVQSSLDDHLFVAAHLAGPLGFAKQDALDLVDAFHALATKGRDARAQASAGAADAAAAFVEQRAAEVVATMKDVLDPSSQTVRVYAEEDRDTGVTPDTLSRLTRLVADVKGLPVEGRAKDLLDGMVALVDAVRAQVKSDPVPAW